MKSLFKKYIQPTDSETTHAVLSASGSERWLGCPASVKLSEGRPNVSHPSALVGTNAHTLLQFILENKNWKKLLADRSAFGFKRAIDFSFRQLDAVMIAVKHVEKELSKMKSPELYVEQKLKLKGVGHGTTDVLLYQPFGTLHVMDYKNGRYKVEPEDNTQGLYYAVAAADKCGWDFKDVHITIIQPNAPHARGPVRTWKTTPERLEKAKLMFERGAARTKMKNPPVIPNSKYCWFCAARPVCPAQMKEKHDRIATLFSKGE